MKKRCLLLEGVCSQNPFFAYRLRTTSARKELGIGLIDDGIVEI